MACVTRWVRFRHEARAGFGTLTPSGISVHDGEMFAVARPTGEVLSLQDVELLAPTAPTKIVALWNNFHALAAKLNSPEPAEPLYLLKAPTSVAAPGAVIKRPASYNGKTTYEGELGIVIGKTCTGVSPDQADAFIFGYTCVNDVTAADILNRDVTFAQWARAKGFDGYGPFGPVIASGIDPSTLVVRTILNGVERQNYLIADMIFSGAAARQQDFTRHDAIARRPDLLRDVDRRRCHERSREYGHGRDRRYWRADQRVSSISGSTRRRGGMSACSTDTKAHHMGVDWSQAK
jgi:2-keto-4-pentenoate hydratase/2-oxohepta-3-ene-1,7-dioic acid hydratase in catechol pathway